MFEAGDRVELTATIEVYGLTADVLALGPGLRFTVVRVLPGRVAVRTAAGLRVTLPARLLRRV